MLTAKIQKGIFKYSASFQGNTVRVAGPVWFVNTFLKHSNIPEIKKAAH